MNSITAKHLRDNLDTIVKRVRQGESIRVTYRSKPAFVLNPETDSSVPAPGSRQAVRQALAATKRLSRSKATSVFDRDKSVKQLYGEMLANDPKYKPPYQR